MYTVNLTYQMDFGGPNVEIGQKRANDQILFLTLIYLQFIQST